MPEDERVGWFSDIEDRPNHQYPWQPCLQAELGLCLSLDIWFPTQEACDNFIKESILGKGMIDA